MMQVRDSFFAINAKTLTLLPSATADGSNPVRSGEAADIQLSKSKSGCLLLDARCWIKTTAQDRRPKKTRPPYMARMCTIRAKMGVRPQGIFCVKLLYGRE
jgi:hypothetical protein